MPVTVEENVITIIVQEGQQGATGATGPTGATGATGAAGTAATISIGTTTTGSPGSNASVTNSGTSSAAVFNFTIPRGTTGLQGELGPQGDPGAVGAPGASGWHIAYNGASTTTPSANQAVWDDENNTIKISQYDFAGSNMYLLLAYIVGVNAPNSNIVRLSKRSDPTKYVVAVYNGGTFVYDANIFTLPLDPYTVSVGNGFNHTDYTTSDILDFSFVIGGGQGIQGNSGSPGNDGSPGAPGIAVGDGTYGGTAITSITISGGQIIDIQGY